MNMTSKLDLKDRAILDELNENAKQTSQQLSKKLRMPITTIHHRIKRMEKEGIIKGYSLRLDFEKIGKPVSAFVLVTIDSSLPSGVKTDQEKISKILKSHDEVESVSIVTGGSDIFLKVRCSSVAALNKFLIKRLRGIDGVDKTQTLVVLEEF